MPLTQNPLPKAKFFPSPVGHSSLSFCFSLSSGEGGMLFSPTKTDFSDFQGIEGRFYTNAIFI
jgi:hypothetical protein